MTTQEEKKECEEGTSLKQCLNYEGCKSYLNNKNYPHLKYKDMCFNCNHWQELLENKDIAVIYIRVEGHHYGCSVSSLNKGAGRYAGFGGRKFWIRLKEERLGIPKEFFTCDMWHQGSIPEHFREKLYDNAEFINEVEVVNFPKGSLIET